MKISGSEQVQISALTIMGLTAEEGKAIRKTTEKLSNEGKTVLNIIHGTPWNSPAGVIKELTFLWEGDDTHPLYLAQKKREQDALLAKQKKQQELYQQQASVTYYKNAHASLVSRIANAQAGPMEFDESNSRGSKIASGIAIYLAYNGFMLFVTITCELNGLLFLLGFLPTSFLLWGYLAVSASKETDSEKAARKRKVELENARRLADRKILDQLKAEKTKLEEKLALEEKKLAALKAQYNA